MKKIILILTIGFFFLKGKSQIAIDTSYFYLDSVSNLYMPKQKVHINEILTNNLNVFKTMQTYSFQKGSEFTFYGLKYTRFDQYFNGIKINGNSYNITSKSDTIQNIGGKVLLNQLPSTAGLISTLTAIQSLTNSLNFYKYKWQDTLWEADIKETKEDSLATYFPKTQLTIFKDISNDYNNINEYYYAYPINISALKSITDSIYLDSLYYVNAVNGNILKRFSPIQTSFSNTKDVSTNFQNKSTIYSVVEEKHNIDNRSISKPIFNTSSCNNDCKAGNVTIHYYGGQVINTEEYKPNVFCTNLLKNNCNGTMLYTRKNGSNGKPVKFTSSNNNWPNQNDKVGITAHWCLEKTYEAYKNLFGFNSFDNAYSQINILINPDDQTRWDKGNNTIIVGKFSGTNSYQAVLDIIGHEFGHGVMNNTTGLGDALDPATTNNGTALNIVALNATLSEGFGDVFGQLVENYINNNYSTSSPNLNDFVQGGDRPGGYLCTSTRSFINPSQTCNPYTLLGSDWVTPLNSFNQNAYNTLIHQNSTVLSHWFYLLAQGGTGNNNFPYNNNYCVKAIGQTKAGNIAFLAATHFIANYYKDFGGARLATIQAAIQLYGANSNEVAQVTEAWYAVGVGTKYNGQINIGNTSVTASGQFDVHYNNKVTIQNVATYPNILPITFYATSNTEIELLSTVNLPYGTDAELYIAPPNPCSAGARLSNTNGGGKNTDSNSDVDLVNAKINNQSEFIFNVQPNPNNGEFKLILNNNNELPKSITIRDYQGKEVKIINNPTEYELTIDLKNLNNGLFIITANYSNSILSKRIIKQ